MKSFEKMFTSKNSKIYQCAAINEDTIQLINRVFGKILMVEEKEPLGPYVIYKINDDGTTTSLFNADYCDTLLISEDGDVELTNIDPIVIGKNHKNSSFTINTAIKREDARRMYRIVNSPCSYNYKVDGKVIKTIYDRLLETGMDFDIQIPGRSFSEADVITITHHTTAGLNIDSTLHFGDYLIIDYDVDKETHEKSNYRIYSMSEDAVNQSENFILI